MGCGVQTVVHRSPTGRLQLCAVVAIVGGKENVENRKGGERQKDKNKNHKGIHPEPDCYHSSNQRRHDGCSASGGVQSSRPIDQGFDNQKKGMVSGAFDGWYCLDIGRETACGESRRTPSSQDNCHQTKADHFCLQIWHYHHHQENNKTRVQNQRGHDNCAASTGVPCKRPGHKGHFQQKQDLVVGPFEDWKQVEIPGLDRGGSSQ